MAVEKRECLDTVGCKLVEPLWKNVWRFPKKCKVELMWDPAIPLPGSQRERCHYLKEIRTLKFIAVIAVAKV